MHTVQQMPLPVFFIKIQIDLNFLVLAFPAYPRKRPLTGCLSVCLFLALYVCMYPSGRVQPTLGPYAEAFIAGPLC